MRSPFTIRKAIQSRFVQFVMNQNVKKFTLMALTKFQEKSHSLDVRNATTIFNLTHINFLQTNMGV